MVRSDARRLALRRFARDFERGSYWDAHEHLEVLWREERLDLWQALIQIAATFVLLGSGRPGGARAVLGRARARLATLPGSLHGVDIGWVRRQCDALDTMLAEPGAPPTLQAEKLFEALARALGLKR